MTSMARRWLSRAALLAALAGSGCGHRVSAPLDWRVRFGPVLGSEVIVGRVIAGETAWIATGADSLVRVDLGSARFTRVAVRPLDPGEHIWGLARTRDNELWTLVGRTALAELSEDGEIVKRVALDEPHVGVFGSGRDLVFQVMNFQPPANALEASPPGGAMRRRWSHMRTRDLPYARGAVAALNLVSCGGTAGAVLPCWFPDQPAVTLVDRSGESRELALEGLPVVSPEVLLASDNPRRPVRDSFVTGSNAIWILGSGVPPASDTAARPGGWLLARYDVDGRLFRRVQLPEPARLLLGGTEDVCVLLSWDGRIVEVRP